MPESSEAMVPTRVSVIMPAYNAAPYIADAIASVLDQDHADLELLVVDNNSTDGTMAVVRTFTDARVRSFHQPVQGVSAARNMALEQMSGGMFCFLDADDVLPPGSLSARFRLLTADTAAHFADGPVEMMDVTLTNVLSVWRPTFRGVPYAPLLQLSDSCFCGITWMFRRIAGRTYRFDTRLSHAEDLLFMIGLAREGAYAYTEQTVLRYRRGHASAMRNLAGLHSGYRGLVQALAGFPDPPSPLELDALWRRARRIMWRSYLKQLQPWRALLAALERRPVATP